MKKISLLFSCVAFLFACNSSTSSSDITGTYINHTEDETGQLWDTLEVSDLNPKENLYAVEKRSGILYIRDGKDTLPIEHKKSSFTATYNNSSNNFSIKELGADYILDPKKKTISNSSVKFHKIN